MARVLNISAPMKPDTVYNVVIVGFTLVITPLYFLDYKSLLSISRTSAL